LSSTEHKHSPVVFDDIQFEHRPYDPQSAYAQSKTANVLFAVDADRRWADDGIRVNALMPGGIATNLQRHVGPALIDNARKNGFTLKSTEQGAATSVLLAASPIVEGAGGRYFEDCNEAVVVQRREAETGGRGVARYALDPANAERLWEVSEELVG
jgi:NAD(P)-dependent dehydrogenase (short-subunit alcohol dehydrogenase family)